MGRERFARQLSLPAFGPGEQERLERATVLVAGVGGVGGAAATYLAAAGVGRLVIFHHGALEESDLNRQTLMRASWLGRERAVCALETLRASYPEATVIAVNQPVGGADFLPRLEEADVVLDCRHNFPERYLLNALCVARDIPLVEVAMNGGEGYLTLIRPGQTPCLKCLYPDGDPEWVPLGFPVLGGVAGTFGCLAAVEAIKVLTGWGRELAGRLLYLDLGEGITDSYRIKRNPDCPVCGHKGRG